MKIYIVVENYDNEEEYECNYHRETNIAAFDSCEKAKEYILSLPLTDYEQELSDPIVYDDKCIRATKVNEYDYEGEDCDCYDLESSKRKEEGIYFYTIQRMEVR